MSLDINQYSFEYEKRSNAKHPMMPITWLCVVTNKETKEKFGTTFSAPEAINPQDANPQIFTAFCNNEQFKNQFFIECESVVIAEEKAEPIEIKVIAPEEKVVTEISATKTEENKT